MLCFSIIFQNWFIMHIGKNDLQCKSGKHILHCIRIVGEQTKIGPNRNKREIHTSQEECK